MLKLCFLFIVGIMLSFMGVLAVIPGVMGWLFGVAGNLGGITIGLLAPVCALVFAGVIVTLVCSGVGVLVAGVLGFVVLILALVAAPVLIPLLIVGGAFYLAIKLILA